MLELRLPYGFGDLGFGVTILVEALRPGRWQWGLRNVLQRIQGVFEVDLGGFAKLLGVGRVLLKGAIHLRVRSGSYFLDLSPKQNSGVGRGSYLLETPMQLRACI